MSYHIEYGEDGSETRIPHCDACQQFFKYEHDLIHTFQFGSPQFEKQWRLAHDYLYNNCTMFYNCKLVKRGTRLGNQHHIGTFAGTLTMSTSDPYNEEDMIHAIKKIMNQKTSPVKRYVWYLEYTESGTPHIHFIYETISGGRILRQVFTRYWKIWDEESKMGKGHRGGYHKPVAHEDEYLDYIKKCNGRHVNNWST